MREAENISAIGNLQPDMMGFIFYPPSPRYVEEKNLAALSRLPASILKVGVFVNEDPQKVRFWIEKCRLDVLQFHGKESPRYCKAFREMGIKVIKAVGVVNNRDIEQVNIYENYCDWVLFDAKTCLFGGGGQHFNWNILKRYQGNIPFLLSGGISSADAEMICRFTHPLFAGIDINSRFERFPAVKDPGLLGGFIKKVRGINEKEFEIETEITD